jgi:hypothetical protein
MSVQGGSIMSDDPPLVSSIRIWALNEQVIFIFPHHERLIYNLAQIDEIYTMLFHAGEWLEKASFVLIPTPDGNAQYQVSASGAVQLYRDLRDLRQAHGLPDPEDLPSFSQED